MDEQQKQRDEQQKQRIKKWIEALRSGEYRQAQDALRVFNDIEQACCHCCLGVACQISGLGHWNDDNEYCDEQDESDGYLPSEVAQYYGLSHREQVDLAEMNDDGFSFKTIADCIEQKILN